MWLTMEIDFKDDFNTRILSRGYEYYEDGLVEDVLIKDNIITAKVLGTEIYDVSVEVDNGMFIDGDCTCPYASEGNYCKHMAALLYYLENENLDENNNYTTKEKQIRNSLKNINKTELDDFLVELLTEDKNIYDKFRLRFNKSFPLLTIKDYEKKIYDAIACSAGRDGFIDYYESWDYTKNMHKITDEINTLVDNGEYDLVFEVARTILETIPDTAIDDSNGSTGEVADSCIEIIERILESILHDENALAKKILDYILNEPKTEYLSNYAIDLYPLLDLYVERNIYLDEIEEGLLDALEVGHSKDYFWNAKYYVDILVDIYNKEESKEKIINLLKKYSSDKSICLRLVEEYLKENNVNGAITLLKTILKETTDRDYAYKLSDIYKKENMMEEYKDILYKLLYELDKYNIDVYKKIKHLYSNKDWLIERDNIINKITKEESFHYYEDKLLNIYIEEKMYDDIFNTIKNEDISTIMRYEEYLLPKYNKELISIYVKCCKSFASKAFNRKMYSKLARDMLHIKKMKNSNNEYSILLEEMREKYHNRPAMQDELSQVL